MQYHKIQALFTRVWHTGVCICIKLPICIIKRLQAFCYQTRWSEREQTHPTRACIKHIKTAFSIINVKQWMALIPPVSGLMCSEILWNMERKPSTFQLWAEQLELQSEGKQSSRKDPGLELQITLQSAHKDGLRYSLSCVYGMCVVGNSPQLHKDYLRGLQRTRLSIHGKSRGMPVSSSVLQIPTSHGVQKKKMIQNVPIWGCSYS